MALTTTTLAADCAEDASKITVTSATGIAQADIIKIDDEVLKVTKGYVVGSTIVPVLRGQSGTVPSAHPSGANLTHDTPDGFGNPAAQVVPAYPLAGRARTLTSYTDAGAIALPTPGTDAVAVINGTSTIAMTLANPTKDQDGDILVIIGNGKSASTVTYTAGLGNAGSGYDVLTLQNAGQVACMLMACNGIWVLLGAPFTGTTTALSIGIA
jgi:hypothetical protein